MYAENEVAGGVARLLPNTWDSLDIRMGGRPGPAANAMTQQMRCHCQLTSAKGPKSEYNNALNKVNNQQFAF